ncbi:hypothetical protein H6G10_15790 [Anabaena cylindrica FACHB-170]|uniref:Uncharacterized protein n=1 Tax=Trichormus variabilis NIES-23 TaxID=1973479 RepID=A0A1Z4KNW7_ANAVA|nr:MULTISPECIES: hypothetical protein [Nostocaceae]MBD2284639.1 hypothetical protein [Anabaena cylindrica FACHB-170]BAB76779.1 asr5080 [Nostoc sp. PCC 7120 = FACHB-418]BAY70681.1 hypothetical protein NIES23_34880 [Trichormus variabilis NIES-23]
MLGIKKYILSILGNQKEKLQMLSWIKSGQLQEQQEIGKRLAKDTSEVLKPI